MNISKEKDTYVPGSNNLNGHSFSSANVEVRGQWDTFEVFKRKKNVKLEFYIYISFRSEGKIKSFSDVGELRNVATNRPAT